MIDAADAYTPSICVVVPCYNEAYRLNLAAFQEVFGSHEHIHFLFVDDGSSDATVTVLQKLCEGWEDRASVLRCERNGGKAEAVRQGIVYALERFHPDMVAFWDADLATPLAALDEFVNTLRENPEIEMVFGARVQLLGRHVHRRAARHYLGRVFATVASHVLNLAIYDTQCGAKMFRVTPALTPVFAEPFLSKWVFDVEIIARFSRFYHDDRRHMEQIIFEYPLRKWTDIAGSKVRPKDFFVAARDVLRIRAKYGGAKNGSQNLR